MGVCPPHQPWSQPNPRLNTGMDPSSPRGHSPTTPVISSPHKDGRSLFPGPDEATFPQSLFNHTNNSSLITPATSPLNTDWMSLSGVSGEANILRQSLHKSPSANTAANPGSVTNTFRGPVCAPPAGVNTASPPDPPRDASSHTSKGY